MKINSGITTEITCKRPQLDLDKIENLEDCKKILKFLCDVTIPPLPEGVSYGGFGSAEQYFK